jgi:hypothetical protein
MKKSLIGGAVTLVLIMGQVNADEVTCPAVADIHRNIEALEDIFSVDAHDGHEWKSESLVAVVDASTLQFKGAKYTVRYNIKHEPTTIITCRYGEINLTLEYPQLVEPTYSKWADKRCESENIKRCRLMSADYFNVSF